MALPFLLVLLPSLSTLPLDKESFHVWMVIGVIPVSIYALTLGCKKHKKRSFFMFGVIGLLVLISALVINEELLGEIGEKLLTVIGASIIAFAHFKNYRLCQQLNKCPCPSEKENNV